MKPARLLARVALVLLAAAVFIGLTQFYAGSMRPGSVNAYRRALRRHRPSEPQLSRFPSFLGAGMLFALIAVAGRLVFRLRLSPASQNEDRVILLDLHQGPHERE